MSETFQEYSARLLSLSAGKDPLSVLASTPKRIAAVIAGRDAAHLRRSPVPGRRSAVQIIAHLADAEIVAAVRRLMVAGAVLACLTGLSARSGAMVVVIVMSLYMLAITADSAALTAGLIEVSPPEARGTAMALYSFFGFAGAFMGPVIFGALLDAGGGATSYRAWVVAFAGVAAVSVAGIVALGQASRESGSGL